MAMPPDQPQFNTPQEIRASETEKKQHVVSLGRFEQYQTESYEQIRSTFSYTYDQQTGVATCIDPKANITTRMVMVREENGVPAIVHLTPTDEAGHYAAEPSDSPIRVFVEQEGFQQRWQNSPMAVLTRTDRDTALNSINRDERPVLVAGTSNSDEARAIADHIELFTTLGFDPDTTRSIEVGSTAKQIIIPGPLTDEKDVPLILSQDTDSNPQEAMRVSGLHLPIGEFISQAGTRFNYDFLHPRGKDQKYPSSYQQYPDLLNLHGDFFIHVTSAKS